MDEPILTEAEKKMNRENFKKRLKDEGKLDNPYATKVPQKNTNFHGF